MYKRLQNDILWSYREVPYHWAPHWQSVFNDWKLLQWDDNDLVFSKWRRWGHANPEQVAFLSHDADRWWIAYPIIDEKRASEIVRRILNKHWFNKHFKNRVDFIIEWSIFEYRGDLEHIWQMFMADSDFAHLWKEYPVFLENITRHFLEVSWNRELTDEDIIHYYGETEEEFFDFLLFINQKTDSPFLTQTAGFLFPHFLGNRNTLKKEVDENPQGLIDYVREFEVTNQVRIFRESVAAAQWNEYSKQLED